MNVFVLFSVWSWSATNWRLKSRRCSVTTSWSVTAWLSVFPVMMMKMMVLMHLSLHSIRFRLYQTFWKTTDWSLITKNQKPEPALTYPLSLFVFQYYEMSYGLNIEMHKQVTSVSVSLPSSVSLVFSVCLNFSMFFVVFRLKSWRDWTGSVLRCCLTCHRR